MNFIARSTVLEEDAGNLIGLTKRQFTNLQTFQGALGDLAAGAITQSGDGERPFLAGGDTFVSLNPLTPISLYRVEGQETQANRREGSIDGKRSADKIQDKFDDAATRTCDDQFNNCADKANAGDADFEVGDCDAQNSEFFPALSSLFIFLCLSRSVCTCRRNGSSFANLDRCKATQAAAQVKSFASAGTGSQQINLGPADDAPGFDIVCDA